MSFLSSFRKYFSPINFTKSFVDNKACGKVLTGPFEGMKYIRESVGSAYYPKLLGTYEKELHATLNSLIELEYENIVVIGAAEGYYACGLSMSTGKKVIAFESNEVGRSLIRQMAKNNQLNVEVFGECSPKELFQYSLGKSLVFMDIEGGEYDFLNAGTFNKMHNSDFILEVHYLDFLEKMQKEFSNLFEMQFFPTEERSMDDFPLPLNPFIRFFLHRYWKSLVQEWRTSNSYGWLILKSLK